jgi:transcriptional regulator NrdR family protein
MARSRHDSGLDCPNCSSPLCRVVDSRPRENKDVRYRRHLCEECGHRFTTYEVRAEEYERMEAIKPDVAAVESTIATLRAIKEQFT